MISGFANILAKTCCVFFQYLNIKIIIIIILDRESPGGSYGVPEIALALALES